MNTTFTGFKPTTTQTTNTKPVPVKLMRKYLNNRIEEVEVGDIVVDIRGKTYYVTGWDEFRNTVQATSTCDQHYFVDLPAVAFNCYFVGL